MDQVVKHIQLGQEQFVKQELLEPHKPPVVKSLTDIALTRAEVLEIRRSRKLRQQQRNEQAERLRQWLQRNETV